MNHGYGYTLTSLCIYSIKIQSGIWTGLVHANGSTQILLPVGAHSAKRSLNTRKMDVQGDESAAPRANGSSNGKAVATLNAASVGCLQPSQKYILPLLVQSTFFSSSSFVYDNRAIDQCIERNCSIRDDADHEGSLSASWCCAVASMRWLQCRGRIAVGVRRH